MNTKSIRDIDGVQGELLPLSPELNRRFSAERISVLICGSNKLWEDLKDRPESEEALAAYSALGAAFDAAIRAEAKYLSSIS
jgi:hypothetical protein